jgi:hypothetical protein
VNGTRAEENGRDERHQRSAWAEILLEEKFHGERWFRLVKQWHGMRLYPRENIAPLVGALNSTEDQAARFRALIGQEVVRERPAVSSRGGVIFSS